MIEIEIDGPHNENLHFRPLQRNVRGRFDLMRVGEPMARVRAQEWPTPLPSQRLGIDSEGMGYLIEPLHDDEHVVLREKIEYSGKRLEPSVKTFENIHLPSWLFWIKQAVDSGIARITKGKFPAKLDGKPRMNYVLAESGPSVQDRLIESLNAQTTAFDRLASAIERLAEGK